LDKLIFLLKWILIDLPNCRKESPKIKPESEAQLRQSLGPLR